MKTIILLAAALGTLSTGALAVDHPNAPAATSTCTPSTAPTANQGLRDPAETSAAGHVKVFDGRDGSLRADDGASGEHIKKAQMHIRKAGGERETFAETSGETNASRVQEQNNLKQIGLANSCK